MITNVLLLKKNFENIVNAVIRFDEPVFVVTNKGNAVIISEEEYNSMVETIYLTLQPGLIESIKETLSFVTTGI